MLSEPLASPASPGPALVPFCFWLPAAAAQPLKAHPGVPGASAALGPAALPRPAPPGPDPRQLRAAITAHLATHGWRAAEPLRWAITAVDPLRGWQLEGVAVCAAVPFPSEPG